MDLQISSKYKLHFSHTEEYGTMPLWVLSLWKDTCNEKILCSQLIWKIPGECSG